MKKILALLLTMMMLFAGCSPAADQSSPEPEAASPEQGEAATRTITDMLGREVEIPSKIETAAVAGSAARMLTYAGCADKLVGVTDMDKSNDPGMPYTVVNAENFADLTPVGAGGSKDVTYDEALVTLNPDIIFAYKDLDTVTELQQKTNIPVVGLKYEGIFSDDVYSALELVGDIMGTSEHCTKVIEGLKAYQKDLNDRTKDIPDEDKPTVYAGAVSFRGGHGIDGTYAKYPPFVAINAKNVVDETGESGALMIDKEKIVVWDPEIIFLTPGNMNLVNEDYAVNKSFYDGLQAVKNGNIYAQVSYNYNSTNIEIAVVDAYYAGMIIYPDKFADIDFEKKADEIFTLMLGEPYLQKLNDSGQGFSKLVIGE